MGVPLTHDSSSYLESICDSLELEAILESDNAMSGRYRADCNDEFIVSTSRVSVWG